MHTARHLKTMENKPRTHDTYYRIKETPSVFDYFNVA